MPAQLPDTWRVWPIWPISTATRGACSTRPRISRALNSLRAAQTLIEFFSFSIMSYGTHIRVSEQDCQYLLRSTGLLRAQWMPRKTLTILSSLPDSNSLFGWTFALDQWYMRFEELESLKPRDSAPPRLASMIHHTPITPAIFQGSLGLVLLLPHAELEF